MHDEEVMSHDSPDDADLNEDDMPAPSHDEVEQWRHELDDIEAKISSLNERKALLQQVLETMPAIEKLRGNAPLVEPEGNAAHQADDDDLKLVNAIPMVLEKYRRPMMPGEIKKLLKNVGFTKPYGETYFYTAMKRAAEKKAIVKKSDGRYRIASSPASNANGDARDG